MNGEDLELISREDPWSEKVLPALGGNLLDFELGKRKLTIASIDDSAVDLEILRRHLRTIAEWDINFLPFNDLESAWSTLENGAVDILFIDYMIGHETGLEALRDLRALNCHFPIILLTGCGSENVAVEALHLGASDYLNKGTLCPNSLKRSVTNSIQKTKLLQSVRNYRENLEQTLQVLSSRNQQILSFYHTVSHELKTPLASSLEFLSLVLEGVTGPLAEDQHSYLRLSFESLSQMKQIINDLLDSARLDTGKFRLHREVCSLGSLVLQSMNSIALSAKLKRVSLTHHHADDLPLAIVDPARIQQVLVNLLTNALKFTPEGGTIQVHVRRSEKQPKALEVLVQDSGRGMSTEEVGRVFEPFFQGEKASTNAEAGLGLGLSISRDLVMLNGGEIWLESQPGKGSAFYFTVPIHSVEEEKKVHEYEKSSNH